MENLDPRRIQTFVNGSPSFKDIEKQTDIRKNKGHFVSSYLDLVTKIAELQFRNPNYVLLFRGQGSDYLNRSKNTSLKPTLFRPRSGETANPDSSELDRRFRKLKKAERLLVERYASAHLIGVERLKRQRILRWAILQHYEICPTPLMDVTYSLRIACSFGSDSSDEDSYLFVLAVPHLSGVVTASAEAGVQMIRLASACPPSAIRPHIQEGYLLGEYPDMGDYDQKANYSHYEVDFGRRLIAKFRFDPDTFWDDPQFPQVG
ncbi:MAG: FRG domain-containing protein, partial [Opitutae bacterium]|nr:FRG domain-containing protein [Opitutae bacterium]